MNKRMLKLLMDDLRRVKGEIILTYKDADKKDVAYYEGAYFSELFDTYLNDKDKLINYTIWDNKFLIYFGSNNQMKTFKIETKTTIKF